METKISLITSTIRTSKTASTSNLFLLPLRTMQKKCAKKESQEYECLQDWVQHVKKMVRCKANNLRKTVESKRQEILELNSVKECSKELQEKYVFVPADKAANNIIVVCKRYHLEVICKELGQWPDTTSSDTQIAETMDSKEISGNHISYMKSLAFKEDNPSDKSLVFIGLQSSTNTIQASFYRFII